MAGFSSDTNGAYNGHSGINWPTVAAYGAVGAVGLGMVHAGGRGLGKAWRKHDMTSKMRSTFGRGMKGPQRNLMGQQFSAGGAGWLAGMGAGAPDKETMKRLRRDKQYANSIATEKRLKTQMGKLKEGDPRLKALGERRGVVGGSAAARMDEMSRPIAMRNIANSKGWSGAGTALGWLGAFDHGSDWSLKRAGAVGARGVAAATGLNMAGSGLGWLFD